MTDALAKLDKATQMLAEAKSFDEVKNIMDIAEAARTYARAAKLGLEAQNHAAEIKIRAERKAGDLLLNLERKPGERTDKPHTSLVQGSEYREVLESEEIPNTTAHRWQQAAQIPEKVFEQHVAQIKDAGLELTTSGLLKSTKSPHVAQNTGESEWYTPFEYIACARAVMGSIDLDPASSEIANKTVGAKTFFTFEDDGLLQEWSGRIWMNPPYSAELVRLFIAKYSENVKNGNIIEGMILVNNATETQWFRELVYVSSAILFPTGRIKFIDPHGEKSGAPLQGQALAYFGNNVNSFISNFGEFGWIAKL